MKKLIVPAILGIAILTSCEKKQNETVVSENTAKTEIIFRKAVWISGSRKDPVDPKSRTAFERRIQR